MTQTETKWSERVREWRASGQSAAQFVEGRGFEASTLQYWASRLKAMGIMVVPEATTGATPAKAPAKASMALLRVRRAVAPEAVRSTGLTIGVGAARIEVGRGFDRTLLREVVDVLGGER